MISEWAQGKIKYYSVPAGFSKESMGNLSEKETYDLIENELIVEKNVESSENVNAMDVE